MRLSFTATTSAFKSLPNIGCAMKVENNETMGSSRFLFIQVEEPMLHNHLGHSDTHLGSTLGLGVA